MPGMAGWGFIVDDDPHRTVGAEVVDVRIRLVGMVPRFGQEQKWISEVASVGGIVYGPHQMSGGIDYEIDFHCGSDGGSGDWGLVGRHCDG